MPRAPWLTASLVSAALIAAPVHAQPAPLDTVHLRDGGLIRGTILELQPGRSVTIQPAGDEPPKTLPWDQVESTSLAGAAPAPTAAAAPARPAPLSEDMFPGTGQPRLTIELRGRRPVHLLTPGSGPLTLSSSSTTVRAGLALRSVCQSPCGQLIDAREGYPYYFGGDRIPLSRPFYLNHLKGDVVAEVRPGRVGLLFGGVLLASYGGVGVITGGTLLGIDARTFARPGGIALGVGLAMLIGGTLMAIRGQTRYKLRPR